MSHRPLRPALVALALAAGLLRAAVLHAHALQTGQVERATLVVRGGPQARAVLRLRWRGTTSVAPDAASLRLHVGSRQIGPLALGEGGWRERRRGIRWRGSTSDGVRRALVKTRRSLTALTVEARGAAWDAVAAGGPAAVTAVFVIGDTRACADFAAADVRAPRPARLRAAARAPFAPCPCDDVPASTWEGLERVVIARHGCLEARCHGTPPGSATLDLTPAAAWQNLVGVPSEADPTLPRVAPGNPAGSMLWRKLAASTLQLPGVPGNAMPLGGTNLDANELDALARWIEAGAPREGTVPDTDALLGICPP